MVDLPNHFFKFISPGFKFNLSIPKSFLANLNGWKCKTAILKRGCHKWPVHITDEGVFGDGWRKFVIDNGVQELDFIVFKHQGNMVFDFFVFDQSSCERQYPNLFDDVEEPLTESDTLNTHKRLKTMVDKSKGADYSSQSKDDGCCFETIMTPSCIGMARLNVPMKFARSNGLNAKKMHTQIDLVDEAKRTWSATLRINTDQTRLAGLGEFIIENDLKAGDTCMFELVKTGEKPVFNFYRKKPTHKHFQVQKKPSLPIKKETGSTRYFMSTLKPYSLEWSRLYLPAEFSMSNALRMGETVLRDDKDRSWKVQLHSIGKTRLYLGLGFEEFLVANGLKIGDAYKLELVENEKDKPPVLNFSILGKKLDIKRNKINETSSIIKKAAGSSVRNRSSKFVLDEKQMEKGKPPIMNDSSLGKKPTHKHIQVKKETSSACFFISTLHPSYFRKSCLYLPAEFSTSNDLRKGEMILRDDEGRSWEVQLNKSAKDRFCVGCGFGEFLFANGLREGDAYKFELVENEKNKPPVVNFSLKLGIPSKTQETKSSHSTRSRIHCAAKVDSTLSETEDRPYYTGELKSYHIKKSILYLPSEFARRNGLVNKKEMILQNVDERSWTVEINSKMNKYCYVGWKEFYLANGLKEGDMFKLELVSNGEIPVAKFYLQNS